MVFIRIKKGEIRIPKNIPKKDREVFNVYISRAYSLNKKFWGTDVPIIKIKLVYTRKEFDKEWGSKTERWLPAMADENRIVIFAPSVFERLTDHKLSFYSSTLVHEINHAFYMHLISTKPVWIMEGLAAVVAKQGRNWRGKIDQRYLFYTYRNKNMRGKAAKWFYRASYLMTKKLIESKGKKEIISSLRRYGQHPDINMYMQLKKRLA